MKTTIFLSLALASETLPGFHWGLQILFIGIALGLLAISFIGLQTLWQILQMDFDIGPSNLTLQEIVEELEGSQ